MLLPGCAKREATGTTGKVALVRGCLMGSGFNAPGVQVLAGGVEAGGCGSFHEPWDDGDPVVRGRWGRVVSLLCSWEHCAVWSGVH